MANDQDLNDELDRTEQAVIDDETADDSLEKDLRDQIAALEAGKDTAPIIQRLKAIQAKLHAPATPADPPPATGGTPS